MIKRWMLALAAMLSLPLVAADLGQTLANVWHKIIYFASLEYIGVDNGSGVVAFTRILLGIITFTLFFAVITVFGKEDGGKNRAPLRFFNRSQAMIISLVLAVMVGIFLPPQVILGVGAGWATAMALILIGTPIIGIMILFWKWPEKAEDVSKATYFIKFVACLLLLWILSAMKYHVSRFII